MQEQREATPDALYELIVAQGFRCALSGRPLSPESAELDHRVALADGGTDDIGNLQWIEASINRAKGSMGTAAFVEMCRAVAAQAERTGEQKDTTGPWDEG